MKILIVPSWYTTEVSPNSGIFFKEQALALQESSVEVAIIYPQITSLRDISKGFIKSGIVKKYESDILTYRYLGYHYLPKFKNGTRHIIYSRMKKLYKYYVKENGHPDLIHAHSVRWGGWAASKIAKKYNIPFVITEHSSAYGRDLIPTEDKPLIKETLNSADQIISVGEGLKKELEVYVQNKSIKVIPNIVDMEQFSSEGLEYSKKKEFIFFSLAFLTKNKGMDVLIKSFSLAFKNNNQVKLVIGGDGEERSSLEKLVAKEGLINQVEFLGALNRKEVVEQMHNCDVFVLASKYETFGVVYIEALASGKPIIATKCGGPEEIVNDKNGLLVEVDNTLELHSAMIKIKKTIENYDDLNIISETIKRYSSKNIIRKLHSIYEEELKKKSNIYEK